MIRYFTIGILSITLFFPAYWVLHAIAGPDIGAGIAALLMYLVFPAVLLNIWKTYPPIYAIPVEPDDEDMQECINRSLSEIDRFKTGLKENTKEAFVKYTIETENETKEHVWGIAHTIEGNSVVVSMVNEPVNDFEENENPDPRVLIPINEIEDWMLVDKDGNCEGGYTHLALVKIYKKMYGKVPKKYLKDFDHFIDIRALIMPNKAINADSANCHGHCCRNARASLLRRLSRR